MYMHVELINANNMADIEEELLLQANLFLLLVLKRRQRQPQNRRKQVLDSKNIYEETRTWGFPHTGERTSCFRQRELLQVSCALA